MQPIHKQVGAALQGLSTPAEQPPHNTAIDRYFRDWHLTGVETSEELQALNALLASAKAFCCAYMDAREPYWLVMSGDSGCGKTYLAERIRDFMRDHAREVYNAKVRSVIDPSSSNFESAWCSRQYGPFLRKWTKLIEGLRNGEWHRIEEMTDDYVKVIDDMGAESMGQDGRPTAFVIGKMGQVCDARLRKWTVITTNFSERQLAELFDARIASRIGRHGNVYQRCIVRDYNVRQALAQKKAAA